MRIFVSYIIASMIASGLYAQSSFDKEPYLTQSLAKESIQSTEVSTSGGTIKILASDLASSRIEMFVHSNNSTTLSKEEVKRLLEQYYVVQIKVSNGILSATAKSKSSYINWKKSVNISFHIYVPTKMNTDLATSGGSIQLNGLDGSLRFKTSGGSLSVENCKGNIDGATSGGSIQLSGCKAVVDMATSGGSIKAENCSGSMDMATSGGSIELENLDGTVRAVTSGGSINARNMKGTFTTATSGGSIRLKEMRCSLDGATSGGNITVDMVEVTGSVKLRNSSGSISLTLPNNKGYTFDLRGQKVHIPLTNFNGETISDNHLKGSMNGGGVLVEARASSGNISVDFR